MSRKCRQSCPWSKTGSLFADDWTKLCNKMEGHAGMHRSVNGALWDEDTFTEPPGMIASMGYDSTRSKLRKKGEA